MDITWYGHSCFRITERGKASVVTDPYDESIGYMPLNIKADIVTVSHNVAGHANIDAVREWQFAIDRPGEYEIGGVFVVGVLMADKKAKNPTYNIAFTIDYGHLSVLHLGDLDHVPTLSSLNSLGQIDVALVPIGGGGALNASQAAEVISLLEPAIVIPMHFRTEHALLDGLEPIEKFLTEMGVTSPAETDTLKVTASSLPDSTQVILLDYKM